MIETTPVILPIIVSYSAIDNPLCPLFLKEGNVKNKKQ
jgi:hypothetical protein